MQFHLPAIAALQTPYLVFTTGGWLPDWAAVNAAALGAGLGVGIALTADKLGSWLLPEPLRQPSLDSFVGEFVSGMWMGGFDDKRASAASQWPRVAILGVVGACSAGGGLHRYGFHAPGVFAALFCLLLAVIASIDIRQRQVPDLLAFPLLWAGLLVNIHASFATPQSAIVGAAAGYLIPWLLGLAVRLLGARALRAEDFKLYAATGAWLGVAALPQIFAGSVALAAVGNVAVRMLGRDGEEGLQAFGPYIALAAGVTMLCGVRLNFSFLTGM